MPAIRRLLLPVLLFLLLHPAALSAQGRTRTWNAPALHYVADGVEHEVAAEMLTLDIVPERLPSRVTLRVPRATPGPGAAWCDGDRMVAPAVAADTLAAAPPAMAFDPAAAMLVALDAPGSNRDPAVRETAAITLGGDGGGNTVVLAETATDSGVFAGALPGAGRADLAACWPTIRRGTAATLAFAGDEGSLATSLSPPVDPAGLVFDAATGAPVDGARVTLLREDGAAATVFGDDGVSRYPATVTSGEAVSDAGGHRYPAVRGRYRFPFVAAGRYRLRVEVPAGFVAPSSAPASALAALRDAAGQPFALNAASAGGTLLLAEGASFAADIPLDHDAQYGSQAALLLTRTMSTREAEPGDRIEVRLALTNRGTVASGALHLVDTLPSALRYRAGSMRGAAEPARDAAGGAIDVALASLAPGGSVELRYQLGVVPGAAPGRAVARARARTPLATSNEAAAAVRIRPLLFTDAMTILGQVGEGGCTAAPRGVAGIRLLLEDGSVVVTDPNGLYYLESVAAGRHVVALDTASLPVGLEPVDCAHDTAAGGSATSRFVEGTGGLVRRVDFRLRRSAVSATPPPAPVVAPSDDAAAAGDRDWLAGRQPGVAWLFPAADHNPRAPVTRVVIQHAPGQRVALTLGGRAVDPLRFDGTDDDGHGVAVSRWVGIALAPGANLFAARVLAADGHVVATLDRVVTVSGPAALATVDAAHSRLLADGSTTPLVAVRVTDAGGRPVRAGTLVPFTVDAPHAPAPAAVPERTATPGRASVPVVGDDGLALLPLRPTGQAGAVGIHVSFAAGEAVRTSDVEAWLTPAAQRWTVVGFGAGSLGYDMLARHARPLPARGRDRRIGDGQLAVYARGRIRGSWLLTLAYDSARRVDAARGLLGQVDPNRYYTVYGDAAAQGQDTPSAARLYLRLEARQAYALFGDVETGLGEARLTRYARTLTGFKAAHRGRNWRLTGFAARTTTLAGHDEIAGTGLTGPYRLRAQAIVANTDAVRIEVRDRQRPDRIVATTPLARHLDYEIDTAAGTLRFAAPVASRDAALNPVVIVADYEVESGSAGRLAAGGRVERRVGRLAIGATLIHDETRTAGAGMAGIDAVLRLAPGTTLRTEVAAGGNRGLAAGGAFVGEVEHHRAGLDLVAYVRRQALGFGLGQQSLVEAGTRKFGADLRWTGGEVAVTATAWQQAMIAGAGRRMAGQGRVDWRRGARTLFAGVEVASDRGLDGGDRDSRLLAFGASQVLAGGALTLTGETRVAPGGQKASVDFPVRHQVEAAWRVSPALRLIGGYALDDGAAYRARTLRAGLDLTPWRGARLASTLNQRAPAGNEQGRRFAQYSIAQSLPLGARWTVDATLDSTTTLAGAVPAGAQVAAFQPIAGYGAVGQDAGDSRAATLGAAYRAGPWSARARLEYRDAATERRWSLGGDVLRALGEGRTLAAGGRVTHVVAATGAAGMNAVGDVALAWRPPASRWTLLNRLTLRHDRGGVAGSDATPGAGHLTTRLIDNIALDYRGTLDGRGQGVEASLSYGIKQVSGRYADEAVGGLIDATGVALRRGFGPHLDIGVAASVQHGWSDRRWAWSGGPSLGLSPVGDVWMTLGYNVAGYRDRDLAADRYTRAGPYLTVRLKFDARAVGMAAHLLGAGR